jgi:HPt (histidine-containing phosphotransfer) domain-containing protein
MAMTAHALKNERENCLNMGMDDYISKPFDPEEFFMKVLKFAPKNQFLKESMYDNSIETILNTEVKPTKTNSYTNFHLDNLVKIYQDSSEKIVKIVSMCYESIPNEISEIQHAYSSEQWDILRNKAHSLKPKLGYLGMELMQENAKKIEIYSQQEDKRIEIQNLIASISNHWQLATPELKHFINS